VQRLARDEFLSNLAFECGAVRSVLRHDFHSPEAQQRGSIQIVHSVHPEGRTPNLESFARCFTCQIVRLRSIVYVIVGKTLRETLRCQKRSRRRLWGTHTEARCLMVMGKGRGLRRWRLGSRRLIRSGIEVRHFQFRIESFFLSTSIDFGYNR
jgi:hypothetical protein